MLSAINKLIIINHFYCILKLDYNLQSMVATLILFTENLQSKQWQQ